MVHCLVVNVDDPMLKKAVWQLAGLASTITTIRLNLTKLHKCLRRQQPEQVLIFVGTTKGIFGLESCLMCDVFLKQVLGLNGFYFAFFLQLKAV